MIVFLSLLVVVALLLLELLVLLFLFLDLLDEQRGVNNQGLGFLERTISCWEEDGITKRAGWSGSWVSLVVGEHSVGDFPCGISDTSHEWVQEDTVSGLVVTEAEGTTLSSWEDTVGSETSQGDPLGPLEDEVEVISSCQSDTWCSLTIVSSEQEGALGFAVEAVGGSEEDLGGTVSLELVVKGRAPLSTGLDNCGSSVG